MIKTKVMERIHFQVMEVLDYWMDLLVVESEGCLWIIVMVVGGVALHN